MFSDHVEHSVPKMKYLFNSFSLSYGTKHNQPRLEDFPKLNYKYGHYNLVYKNTTDYVRSILDSIKLVGDRNYIIVDIKGQNIIKNSYPCLEGWHTDTVINPNHKSRSEHHHIFVSGSASLTEFIAEPIELEIVGNNDRQKLLNFRNQINHKQPKILKIPSCTIVSYGRWDFHRPSIGLFDEPRLLIRVTETDLIRPQTKSVKFKESLWD